MSDLSPLSGEERKLDFGAVRSVDEPKCDIELIANFHYAQHVDEKSRKIFQDFVLPGSRPKGIL